jgi:hypothetical protein
VTGPADVARLAAKFRIEDSEPDHGFFDGGIEYLGVILDHAAMVYEVAGFAWNVDEYADDLDGVAKLLDQAVRLLDDSPRRREYAVNLYRLARELDPEPDRLVERGDKIIAYLGARCGRQLRRLTRRRQGKTAPVRPRRGHHPCSLFKT